MSLDFPWGTATLEIGNGQEVLTNVGVRFKGNSSFNASRQSDKKPFKLDFNRHAPGRQFFGLNALFLNNNVNDLAYVREPLAYEAFRKAGFPASRTAIVRLYLTIPGVKDHEYLGLYTAVEPVDNLFLDRRLGGHTGLLVKPEGVQGLSYFGDDWHAYTNRYEVHSKLKESDAERLVALTRHVNRSSDTEFARRLGEFVDVDASLRFIALNAMLANLDSFNGNGHNYYLFVSRTTGKATFIPWDLNEAFGGHPGGGPAAAQLELSVLHPASPGNRFVARILADPSLSARYREICDQLLKDAFTVGPMIASVEHVTTAAAGFLREEPRRNRIRMGPGGPPGNDGGDGPGPDGERRDPRGLGGVRGPGGEPQDGERPARPREAGPRRAGGFLGPGGSMPIVDWIRQRDVMIREELAGKRDGLLPQMRRGGGPQRPERF